MGNRGLGVGGVGVGVSREGRRGGREGVGVEGFLFVSIMLLLNRSGE